MTRPARLVALGWDDALARAFEPHAAAGLVAARVVSEHQHLYRVATEEADLLARVSGRARHYWRTREAFPAVGDWVALRLAEAGATARIDATLPRRSRFARRVAGRAAELQVVAANIDVVFLVSGLDHDFNPRRIGRYLVMAAEGGARPVIVLNKVDLADDLAPYRREVAAVAPEVPVVAASARRGDGLDALRAHARPRLTVAFVGSSGVGKSTLINALLGEERQPTREVRASDQRGRHTTRHRELIVMPDGALLIDTPGMRELQLWEAERGIDVVFHDIDALAAGCHFADCTHDREPRCAVKEAVAEGRLPAARLAQYHQLRHELSSEQKRRV